MPGRRSKRAAAVAAKDKIKEEEVEQEEEQVSPPKKSKKGVNKRDNDEQEASCSTDQDQNGQEKEEKSKIKSVVVKGRAPVDEFCPLNTKCHVLQESPNDVWDCMLNQTNIKNNNNKYYLIQLLREDSKKCYHVWMRWGRVGYKGQTSLTAFGGDLDAAKATFTKKFADKTKNDWSERSDFEQFPGKYDLVFLDYNADDVDELTKKGDSTGKKNDCDEAKKVPESKLHTSVQALIRLICDLETMEQAMVEMQYDTKKAPLGKITNQQIKAGYKALKNISDIISANNGRKTEKLLQACNDFYTRIPHDFGMRQPPMITSMRDVKMKIELLEALGDIQVALKILNEGGDGGEELNPVDYQYRQLDCKLKRLEPESDDFDLISNFITSTHGRTHTLYQMKVEEVFECEKNSENANFKKELGNRMLLFHGSRMSNWAGILSQGLRIAPPEAPSTGYMFGKGIYFADMASKSANYCWPTPSKNEGLLLLCEVALGSSNELLSADCDADRLPEGRHSVKGLGQNAPDAGCAKSLSDGTIVPMGPPVATGVAPGSGGHFTLAYNEYIVYDPSQVKMRYLARIKFDFSN